MRELRYTITEADDGRLIKRVIRSRMQVSSRVFSDLKARGGLILDGACVHANHVVRAGQTIALLLVDEASGEGVQPEHLPVDIVFQDQDLMIINKSAPLACQSSPKQQGGTLENRLAALDPGQPFVFRPVNRLDKGTSGLMVAAKNPHAQMLLTRQLHSGSFVREYLAVVGGLLSPPEGTIDLPIGKADGATVRREVRQDGREALTRYRTVSVHGELSLVRLLLGTGRTHQIRVHMAAMGCPVFGDFLYGEEHACLPGRFALHSCHLQLIHPMTGEVLSFDAPLPEELAGLLE